MWKVEEKLHGRKLGEPCIHYRETDSTNIRAKILAEQGAAHGTLVCADTQTAGKGRRGRSWSSPPGEGLYMSLLLRPAIAPAHASRLTLVMGLAAAQACRELLRQVMGEQAPGIQVKWPNDLVLNGKKIAGILTEMKTDGTTVEYVLVGIGMNVNTKEFPEELPAAGSLAKEAGVSETLDREKLRELCMEYFTEYYESFLRTEDLSELQEEYETLLVNRGRTVRVLEPGNEYQGTALGINPQGELLVEREDGTCEKVYAGEVSVRGVYGYT